MAEITARLTSLERRLDRLEAQTEDDQPKTEGVIPGLLLGPKLSLLTLPSPSIGLEVRVGRLLGLSAERGLLPTIHANGVALRLDRWSVAARLHPLRGGFSLGAAFGGYALVGKATRIDATGAPAQVRAKVSSTYVAPQLGWGTMSGSGFFTAGSVGWAFPLRYRSSLDAPAGVSAGAAADVRKGADDHVKRGLPLLALLELGWLF